MCSVPLSPIADAYPSYTDDLTVTWAACLAMCNSHAKPSVYFQCGVEVRVSSILKKKHFLKRVDFELVSYFAGSDLIYQFLCYSLCVVFGILLLPVCNICPGIMCTLIFLLFWIKITT